MRELLLLDLAGFCCGVWKEDILSHEEQIIHWLTDNNGAATAIAMMGAHPVSLADLSYCIGLAPAVRAKRQPVLVLADHDISVSFVVEQEAGMAQVPSSAVFSLPVYLQTAFIDSCVHLDGKLVPLINIRAIYCRVSAGDYTPPAPQFCLPVFKEEREERAHSFEALRVFICNKKSFAASADYFFSEQAQLPGSLTRLPLMPEFVQGITLHNNRVLTVLDIRRYLQLSSATEGEEGKWLIGEVEGQGFAFVVDADQGLLPADSAPLAVLPLLVSSDWQQSVVLHAQKIIPVLDFSELFAKPLDECSQALPQDLHSDGRFEVVFGKQKVEIVEFSILKMIHALPDLEVVDIIPFSHCQRLAGTRGLVAGVTLYRKELLPVLDPARCFGRKSSPGPAWKLLLVCNGDLRVLVLVEDVLGKRSLNVSEQRALPFTAPHSSVYGCYPVASRVGLIFNILALSVYFDDEQINELFFFADDLLPSVNEVELNIDQGTQRVLTGERSEQENVLLRDDLLGLGYAEEAELLSSGSDDEGATEEPFSFFEEQENAFSPSSFESGREDSADDWELEKNASVLLTEEQDTLVQSVVASMLSRKDEATDPVKKDNQDDEAVTDSLEFAGESDDVFLSVMASMLSRKEDDLNSEAGAVSHDEEVAFDISECASESKEFGKSRSVADEIFSEEGECPSGTERYEDDFAFPYENEIYENETSSKVDRLREASPVLLTEEQDRLITSTLASMLLREQKGEDEETSGPGINEELEGEQEVGSVPDKSQRFAEPLAVQSDTTLVVLQDPLQEDEGRGSDSQEENEDFFFPREDEEKSILIPPEHSEPLEGIGDEGYLPDIPVIIFTEEQDALLQSSLSAAFSQQEDEEEGRAEKLAAGEPLAPPKEREGKAVVDELAHGVGEEGEDAPDSDSWVEALLDFQGKADFIDRIDEQTKKKSTKESVPAIEVAGGGVDKDFSQDASTQLKGGHEGPSMSNTWNILEDADTFPELKDFVYQVSGTQQADPPLVMSHADFVKNVTFPPLSSPDPKKIKAKLDKERQKERDILFWESEHEPKQGPDMQPQPKDEIRKRTKLWIFLFLLGLLSGFLLWFFVFRNQEVSRGKSIKPEPQPLEINRETSSDDAVNKSKEKDKEESTQQDVTAALKRIKKTPEEPDTAQAGTDEKKALESVLENAGKRQGKTVIQEQGQDEEGLIENVHEEDKRPDALLQGRAADDSGAGAADDVVLKSAVAEEKDFVKGSIGASSDDAANKSKEESTQQDVTAALKRIKKTPEEPDTAQAKIDKKKEEQKRPAPAAHSSRDISPDMVGDGNKTTVNSVSDARVLESSGDPSKGGFKDSATEQVTKEEKKQVDVSPAETSSVSTELAPAASTETYRSVDQEKINGGDLREEKSPPVNHKNSSLMSPVKGTSGHTRHTVNKGDTLWDISEQYTGSGFNYPDVAKKNKIANPDLIYPAQQVTLPAKK